MAAPQSIRDRYARDLPSLKALHEYVAASLRPWCTDRGYLFEDRLKSAESVAQKIETGRYGRWSEIDDFVAFTIVVPTAAHEPSVLEMLDSRFRRAALRSRGTARKPPDVFRFDTTRWYGRVLDNPQPALDERGIEAVFEVQVKTVFEYAWSTVTHDLVFKGQQVDWREKRLAAQLKALVEQIDLLLDHFVDSAQTISPSPDAETDAQAFVVEALTGMVANALIPESLTPESWQRLAECIYSLIRQRSRRANEAEEKVRDLCERLRTDLESGAFTPAMSGSLFQAVIAYVAQTEGIRAVGDFPVVTEGELQTVYQITGFRVAFDLES